MYRKVGKVGEKQKRPTEEKKLLCKSKFLYFSEFIFSNILGLF